MKSRYQLAALADQLKSCGSRDGHAFREIASDAWETLRNERLPQRPSPAIIAALVVHSKMIGQLLESTEREELLRLSSLALERYEQRIDPPNKLGNLLAGILKEL